MARKLKEAEEGAGEIHKAKACTTLSEVDTDSTNQLSNRNIFIGFLTRQTLLKLEREGDVYSHIRF